MTKTILITGATSGLGLATAQSLAGEGHRLLIHGRSAGKLASAADALRQAGADVESFQADLSDPEQAVSLAGEILAARSKLDVLVNNAGVFKTARPLAPQGGDVRFAVNTFAPVILSRLLMRIMPGDGRILHLSSAAQAPVELEALAGRRQLDAMQAYAQSKLALTIWSRAFAAEHPGGPASIAINPGSLLATSMVRDGFGVSGNDVGIGVDILTRAALSDEFANASGRYFDNDAGRFSEPHPQAADEEKNREVLDAIERATRPWLSAANA